MRAALGLLALALAMVPSISVADRASNTHPAAQRVGLVARDGARLYTEPVARSSSLATFVQQAQVEVLGKHGSWYRVRAWDSVQGWMKRGDITFKRPWSTDSTYHAPVVKTQVRATAPASLRVVAMTTSTALLRRAVGGPIIGSVPAGQNIALRAWMQDSTGRIWFLTSRGWTLGDAVTIPRMSTSSSSSHPRWAPVVGKGMWLTLGSVTGIDPATLVAAAKADGITHLYVESAISPLGFHGRSSVGPLLEAAHRVHLAVIAWVYPYLQDVAADVALTREVAAYRSRHGQTFDGIAADLERNMDAWRIRAYGELVRTYLGNNYLLVGVTYPPQSLPTYPFAEVARQFDVLAPMDYWHQTETEDGLNYGGMRYSAQYTYRYALDSIHAIQAATGGKSVIAPIGQAFDDFGRLEMGPHAPSAAEIRGFLLGCHAGGAPGVSFFQWMTVTSSEWHAIHDFAL